MKLSKLSIKGRGFSLDSKSYKIYLNDQDISHFVDGVSIEMKVGEPTRATLSIFVDEVDMPDGGVGALTSPDFIVEESE